MCYRISYSADPKPPSSKTLLQQETLFGYHIRNPLSANALRLDASVSSPNPRAQTGDLVKMVDMPRTSSNFIFVAKKSADISDFIFITYSRYPA